MVVAQEVDHLGWAIHTQCAEMKPDDWKPGTKVTYAARATAKFEHPTYYPNGFTSHDLQQLPESGERVFGDWTQAHTVLQSEMRARINSLKKWTHASPSENSRG